MANSVTIRTTAPGAKQAAGDINRLKKSVTSMGTAKMGPLGGMLNGLSGISPIGIAAGLGIGALTGALADGVAGALEEDKQLARLGATLQANVKDWDGSTAAVDQFTTAAMDLAFADDDARESMIKLITATGNVEESLKDSRLAMDIARGRNIDLAAATDIVIKANMGNVGALRRLGIELDKGATKTEILATLQERYAGAAAAYAKTTAGKFESAQKKVDDAMEGVGHGLIDTTAGLLSWGDAMKGDTQAAADFFHGVGNIVPGLGMMGDAIDDALEGLGSRGAKDAMGRSMGDVLFGNLQDVDTSGARAAFEASMRDVLGGGERALETWTEQAERFGDNFTDNLADSLRDNKDEVKDAMSDLTFAMNHPLKLEREAARIAGALTSAELAEGLASNNPMIKAVAQQTKADLEAKWMALTGEAYSAGADAAEALARGLSLFDPVKVKPYVIGGGRYQGKHIPGFAAGGDMAPGQTAWVGEKGPELFTAGRTGGHVTPNKAGAIEVHVHLEGDAAQLFRVVDREQGRALALSQSTAYSRG